MQFSNITKSARILALSALASLSFVVSPLGVQAKDGDIIARGFVTSRPAGTAGVWVIGGRSYTATSRTQLDVVDGPLNVGACAKVKVRLGAVHEIDSEPARDCR